MTWTKDSAKKYYECVSLEKKYLLIPTVRKIVKSIKGKNVIDLGCGNGAYSRELARAGKKVTAVDKSAEQLKIAKGLEESQKLEIEYVKSDIRGLKNTVRGGYDIALLNMVLLENSSEKSIKDILKESFRLLRKNGVLVVSEGHPHNINKKNAMTGHVLKRKGDSYYTNGAPMISRASTQSKKTLVFYNDYHYTLEFFVNSLVEAGFAITSIMERSYKENYPTHIFIVARKL